MDAAGLIVQTGYRGSNVRALVHSGTPSVFTFCSVLFLFRVFGVEDRLLRLNLGARDSSSGMYVRYLDANRRSLSF